MSAAELPRGGLLERRYRYEHRIDDDAFGCLENPEGWPPSALGKRVPSEFDGKNPVLIDETLAIVAGESRYWAANELNREDILIVIIPGLSPAQKAKLKASDDAMAEGKRWTAATVRRRLKLIGYDLPQPVQLSAGVPGWNRSLDTRFKPGQSGNKGGHPKSTVSDKSLSEILREPRRVMIDGKPSLMTVREQMERRLIDSAAGGNVFAMQRTISRVDKLCPLEHESIMERVNRTKIQINFVKRRHRQLSMTYGARLDPRRRDEPHYYWGPYRLFPRYQTVGAKPN